ncbi:MAG TPA: hypothetical protein VMF08_02110 [Candidatus Sulfotelmatobacter sp.]|nr:hypothetical protein [Candidatus Sulfotelmatobacter sp.]
MKSVFILLFALIPLLCVVGQDTNLLSRLDPVPPFPELQTVAKTNNIPLEGIGPVTATNVLPGDSLATLVTLHQKRNRLTQWLVYFEVVAGSNQPSSRPAKPVVLYNSMGDKFEFPNVPVTFRIRTIGPYVNSASFWGAPAPKDDDGRASVNGTFLALGLDGGMAAIYRMNGVARKTGATNFDLEVTVKPRSEATIKKNQKLAARLHLTPEERRAVAAGGPALTSYFQAVGETPDLEGMMWKVISFPSIWSIVKHRGITASLDFDVDDIHPVPLPPGWDLPGPGPVYSLPLSLTLNGKPALDVTLIVTSPSPALVACGGIVGFVAQNPDDDENYLVLRVVSARRPLKTLKR